MVSYDFSGKNVIVTGAGSGLGKEIADEFAKAGANVAYFAHRQSNADEVVAEAAAYGKGKKIGFGMEVTEYASFEKAVDATVEAFGSIDIFVNNAGIGPSGYVTDQSVELIDSIIDTNVKGTLYGSRLALKYMLPAQAGTIVNIASIAAKMCAPRTSVYAASKSAVVAFTGTLARDVAAQGVTVNAVLPGIIRTKMWENQLMKLAQDDMAKRDAIFKDVTSRIPQQRPQEPEDVAKMVMFLASDEAKNITGQAIAVDGGSTVM